MGRDNFEELTYTGEFRLLLHPKMEGRLNMAIDEALLESVMNENAPPVIRLYGFKPPTLTYGRFQHIRNIIDLNTIEKNGISFVRRPTGGQAVLHDDEVTYSVILSRKHITPFRKRIFYNFVAKLLLQALKEIGVDARINERRKGNLHNPNCFATSGEYEIISKDGKKLIGSAQTTTRYGGLQHGAIPIGPSFLTISQYLKTGENTEENSNYQPHATYINNEIEKEIGFQECTDKFSVAFQNTIKIKISELSKEEQKRADQLFKEKYNTEEWNLMY